MKKLFKIIVSLIIIITINSCSELTPSEGVFVVRTLESYGNKDGKPIYKYQINSIKGFPNFYYISNNFYNVGDTLVLKPVKKLSTYEK